MNRFSKVIAFALATTMVIGSSVTAFAGENTGSSTGAGASEGHVEKKATTVVLPTVPTDGEGTESPFRYTMDPEGLIAATAHQKYGDAVEFPASNDTSVYFNTGKKGGDDDATKDNIVYANTSAAQTVTNKSSHAIELTVTAAATTAATDIPLVAKDAYASAENPSLYLGLKVGSETPVAIAAATPATKTVTIDGTEGNFKIAVKSDNSGYEYRVLTYDEWKALDGNGSKSEDDFNATWKNSSFQLEGGVTTGKAITSATTAPTVAVTWSWADPSATPASAAPSIATTEYTATAETPIEITVNLGVGDAAATGIASITYVNKSGVTKDVEVDTGYTFSDNKITLTAATVDAFVNSTNDTRVYTVTFDDSADTTVNITLSK